MSVDQAGVASLMAISLHNIHYAYLHGSRHWQKDSAADHPKALIGLTASSLLPAIQRRAHRLILSLARTLVNNDSKALEEFRRALRSDLGPRRFSQAAVLRLVPVGGARLRDAKRRGSKARLLG